MSRVERTENPNESRRSTQLRQAERGRGSSSPRDAESSPGPTPSKAEGEESDVEQALERQSE
jgi:hypothetical protein